MLNVALAAMLALGLAQAHQEPQPVLLPAGSLVSVPDDCLPTTLLTVAGTEHRVRLTIVRASVPNPGPEDIVAVFEAARLRFTSGRHLWDASVTNLGGIRFRKAPLDPQP